MTHVRAATVHDVDALLALRAVMFDAMDIHPADNWQGPCRLILLDGLMSGDLIGTVAETDDGAIVASGIAAIHRWLPSPANPAGLKGYVGSMATQEPWRRRGIGRRVAEHLIDTLATRGVSEIELHATEAGEGIYRSLGFAHRGNTTQLTLHTEAD
jgi:GNAT superfamily N-acetyltransferase